MALSDGVRAKRTEWAAEKRKRPEPHDQGAEPGDDRFLHSYFSSPLDLLDTHLIYFSV